MSPSDDAATPAPINREEADQLLARIVAIDERQADRDAARKAVVDAANKVYEDQSAADQAERAKLLEAVMTYAVEHRRYLLWRFKQVVPFANGTIKYITAGRSLNTDNANVKELVIALDNHPDPEAQTLLRYVPELDRIAIAAAPPKWQRFIKGFHAFTSKSLTITVDPKSEGNPVKKKLPYPDYKRRFPQED